MPMVGPAECRGSAHTPGMEPGGTATRPTVMRTACTTLALITAMLLTGCSSDSDAGRATLPPEDAQTSADPTTALALCEGAVGEQDHVIAAAPTTVQQVLNRRGGPDPGTSPAKTSWASLPSGDLAAWCTVETGDGRWTVSAATLAGSLVDFMTSTTPLTDAYSEGPAIP